MKHNTLSLLYLCLKIYLTPPPPPQLQYNPNDTVVSSMYCEISREVQIVSFRRLTFLATPNLSPLPLKLKQLNAS